MPYDRQQHIQGLFKASQNAYRTLVKAYNIYELIKTLPVKTAENYKEKAA